MALARYIYDHQHRLDTNISHQPMFVDLELTQKGYCMSKTTPYISRWRMIYSHPMRCGASCSIDPGSSFALIHTVVPLCSQVRLYSSCTQQVCETIKLNPAQKNLTGHEQVQKQWGKRVNAAEDIRWKIIPPAPNSNETKNKKCSNK
jgi:hypothetical protein